MLHDNTGRICLLIHNANKKDAGWYTVSAVNGAGVATCHARLEVASKYQLPVPQKVHWYSELALKINLMKLSLPGGFIS